jgi:hypothetical protein
VQAVADVAARIRQQPVLVERVVVGMLLAARASLAYPLGALPAAVLASFLFIKAAEPAGLPTLQQATEPHQGAARVRVAPTLEPWVKRAVIASTEAEAAHQARA